MFIQIQSLLVIFFLFQWIWGPARVYASEVYPPKTWTEEIYQPENFHLSCYSSVPNRAEERGLKKQDSLLDGRLFPNELREYEEWILLKGLDSLCADTWCEGSFDFHFFGFKCSFKEESVCLMSYRSWDQTLGYTIQKPFSFICVIRAMDRKRLFGDQEADFWISDDLYSAVSECIREGEKWIEEGE